LPQFEDAIESVRESRRITLDGVGGFGDAALHRVTTDFAHGLAEI
jgi:hypothetical protein